MNSVVRVLRCLKCLRTRQMVQKTALISFPIMNYNRKQFKIVFDSGSEVQNIIFDMNPDGTVGDWKNDIIKSIPVQEKDPLLYFAEVNANGIIRNLNSVLQHRPFKFSNIRSTDYIVVYKLQKVSDSNYNLKRNYYIYKDSRENYFLARQVSNQNGEIQIEIIQNGKHRNQIVKSSQLSPYLSNDNFLKTSKNQISSIGQTVTPQANAIIQLLNRNKEYDLAIYYPHILLIDIQLPIKAIRTELQKVLGNHSYELKIVGKSERTRCYFCRNTSCNCFKQNQQLFPIEWLLGQVQFMIIWKTNQAYRNAHKKVPDFVTSPGEKWSTKLSQSLKLFQAKEVLTIQCQNCRNKNSQMQSWQQIRQPSQNILIIHLKRFTYDSKIYTKWNLQTKIKVGNFIYQLSGVILHLGDGKSGHYMAVADQIKYDDSWVDAMPYGKIPGQQIYILFYQRNNSI